jgi:hypothetical protein
MLSFRILSNEPIILGGETTFKFLKNEILDTKDYLYRIHVSSTQFNNNYIVIFEPSSL